MSTYLITQATGHQAQWTITHLLSAGAKIHALIRDPTKIPTTLQHPEITVFPSEDLNPSALLNAARGCTGAFLNTYPSYTDVSYEGVQAKAYLGACISAGISTVVASTAFYTGSKERWSNPESHKLVGRYYESKTNIEDAVRGSGLAYTILRPAYISHDYVLPNAKHNYPELHTNGTLAHAFDEGVGMLQIDEHDVGKFAAAALLDPAKFGGQEIELGNEYLSIEEVRDIIERVSGRKIKIRKWGEGEIEVALNTIAVSRFMLWANLRPMKSTAKETEEKFGIKFTGLEEYLVREKAKLMECLPAEM